MFTFGDPTLARHVEEELGGEHYRERIEDLERSLAYLLDQFEEPDLYLGHTVARKALVRVDHLAELRQLLDAGLGERSE